MFDPSGEERAEGFRIHHLRKGGNDAGADQDRQSHYLRHGSRPPQGYTQAGMLLSSVMKFMSNKQFSFIADVSERPLLRGRCQSNDELDSRTTFKLGATAMGQNNRPVSQSRIFHRIGRPSPMSHVLLLDWDLC